MKAKIITVVFVAIFIGVFSVPTVTAETPPLIQAESVCLIDADSGKVLFSLNDRKIMYPASTTKIVTCLLALNNGKLSAPVQVGSEIYSVEGSSLDLKKGDRLTLLELLYGMMLVSGNDAAETVAQFIGGTRANFITMMNQYAMNCGAEWTHFSNPHGLPDSINHYTTAYDMALIARAGYKVPDFVKIVSMADYTVRFLDGHTQIVKNTNKLLRSYSGANGVKTGYTQAAGDCLVAAAKRNGRQLIVVIYNDDERWADAAVLLNYGFANF